MPEASETHDAHVGRTRQLQSTKRCVFSPFDQNLCTDAMHDEVSPGKVKHMHFEQAELQQFNAKRDKARRFSLQQLQFGLNNIMQAFHICVKTCELYLTHAVQLGAWQLSELQPITDLEK